MKKYFCLLTTLAVLFLTSCIKENDGRVYSDECYVSNVTLGTMRRAVKIKTEAGTDSVAYTTYSGHYFKMTVDQRNNTIENRDSLLYGTSVDAVLMNITFTGGVVAYRPADEDTLDWSYYNNTDSMDLTKPLHLYVVAEDSEHTRTYTLKVNVHQQEGDSLYWTRLDSVSAFDGMTAMRAVVKGAQLMVLGKTSSGVKVALRTSLDKEGQWKNLSTNLPQQTEVQTLKLQGENLFVSTADGVVYTSLDGLQWTACGAPKAGLRLAAVTERYLYAVLPDGIYRSADGANWDAETLDDEVSNLPYNLLNGRYYIQENGLHRLQILGCRNNEADTVAVVWSKVWTDSEPEGEAEWVYCASSYDMTHACPRLNDLTVVTYDGRGMAFGGASPEGLGVHKAMDGLYFSNDHGLTWHADAQLHCPTALYGVSGPLAGVVDEDKFIWIIADHQVWRGRLNRLAFERQ